MRISTGLSALALSAVLAASPVLAASINLGGNGNGLLGTGLLGGGNSQSSGNSPISVNANVGGGTTGSGNNGGLLNLFGNGQGETTATVNVGTGNGTGSSTALLDLFGNGGDTGDAQVTLGVAGLGSGTDAGGVGNVTLDLFGDGSQPIGTTPEPTGGNGGTGASGGGIGGGTSTTVASLDSQTGGTCFTPDANQLAKLVGRHTYDAATFDGWMGVTTIKVIRAGLCNAAVRDIASQSNIGLLQTYFSTNAALRGQLAKWGHAPGDVIAVDRQGSTLVVYVA